MKKNLISAGIVILFAFFLSIFLLCPSTAFAFDLPGKPDDTAEETSETTTESTTEDSPGILAPDDPPVIETGETTEESTEDTTEDTGEDTTEKTTEETTEKTTDDTTEDTSEDTTEDTAESTTKATTETTGVNTGTDSDDDIESSPLNLMVIGICAAVIIVVLIIVIIVLLANRNKKEKKQPPTGDLNDDIPPNTYSHTEEPSPAAVPIYAGGKIQSQIQSDQNAPVYPNNTRTDSRINTPGSIPVKYEIFNGQSPSENGVLYLTTELVIGSSSECDIVFNESFVAPKNTRIFNQNGTIFIENMNPGSTTHVAGLKVSSAVPLRSGDVISIGEAEFCLTF